MKWPTKKTLAGTLRTGTGYYTNKSIMALQAYNIMKKRKTQFHVSDELQIMHVSTIESAAASRRLAIAFSPVFLSFIYLLTGTGCGNDSFVTSFMFCFSVYIRRNYICFLNKFVANSAKIMSSSGPPNKRLKQTMLNFGPTPKASPEG